MIVHMLTYVLRWWTSKIINMIWFHKKHQSEILRIPTYVIKGHKNHPMFLLDKKL